jgi:uncharacterized phage protein (TIGR02218 family)
MTFSALERLVKGTPVEFYEFRRSANYWRYSSSDVTQTFSGNTFAPSLIKRSKIRFGGGMSAENVMITLPRTNALAATYIAFPPADTTSVTIYGQHRSDGESVVIWQGRVKNAEFKGALVDLACESILTAQKAQGLRRTFGAGCSHALYDQSPLSCTVNKELFKVAGSLISVTGNRLECSALASKPDGYWVGGLLEYLTAGGVTERRLITGHVGFTATLISPIAGLAAGQAVSLFPGCDRSTTMCVSRFNNLPNYGGFPYMPTTTPFNGTMLF